MPDEKFDLEKYQRLLEESALSERGTEKEIGSSKHEPAPPLETPQPLAPSSPQQTETSREPAQPVTDTPEQHETPRATEHTVADTSEQPDPPYKPETSVTYAAEQDETPYSPDQPITHTPAHPETERSAGEVAPGARALTPPETGSSVPNTSGAEESFSVAQERTHAQPATSPPQPYAAPAIHPGDVAGRSSAAERRRTNGATPDLHALTRALDRELRRYG